MMYLYSSSQCCHNVQRIHVKHALYIEQTTEPIKMLELFQYFQNNHYDSIGGYFIYETI